MYAEAKKKKNVQEQAQQRKTISYPESEYLSAKIEFEQAMREWEEEERIREEEEERIRQEEEERIRKEEEKLRHNWENVDEEEEERRRQVEEEEEKRRQEEQRKREELESREQKEAERKARDEPNLVRAPENFAVEDVESVLHSVESSVIEENDDHQTNDNENSFQQERCIQLLAL